MQTLKNDLKACKFYLEITFLEVVVKKKKSTLRKCYFRKYFGVLFFCHDFHEWYFGMKFASTDNICQILHPKKSKIIEV